MATRCTCRWVSVQLAPELAALLLRETDDAECPTHNVAHVEHN